MSTLIYILIFNFIGSIASMIGGIALLVRENFANRISHYLAAFAAGTLLGTVFFDLLPEAMEQSEVLLKKGKHADVLLWCLLGILFFFYFERFIHWFHHHSHAHEDKTTKPTVALITLGDGMHNFIDGVAIAATFLSSVPLGIITSLAVAAHEIPQEIGDFGILLDEGVSRKRVLLLNLASATTSVAGALMAYYMQQTVTGLLAYIMALTSGFFIYISLSDLIPHIHERVQGKKGFAVVESLLLVLGVIVIWVSVTLLEGKH